MHHHHDVDEGGWEYSFMFAKKFSWHGPQWWNSFVRRRVWIRQRVRKSLDIAASRTHSTMLNADYFSVVPASDTRSRESMSRAGSGMSSVSQRSESDVGFDVLKQRIEDVDSLLYVLRRARIDREKAEAVGTYLEQGTDLESLRPRMHEIMAMFVFQASRTLLLAKLTQALNKTLEALGDEEESAELKQRRTHLEDAIKCADEEVKKLAYWSDIKGMVEGGEAANAVREGEGWGEDWQGVDQSGPTMPRRKSEEGG